jgi:hypothetical protein
MRRFLAAVCLLTVALSGGAAAQTAKECAILKRALYGDSVVDGNRSLSDANVPVDLRWPVSGGGPPNLSVGKGEYRFYFHFTDAAAHTKAKQLFEMFDKQVAQCLPNAKRNVGPGPVAFTYCPPGTAKSANIYAAYQSRFGEVGVIVTTETNRAQSCR